MQRFAFFVDGSNLFGSIRGLGIEVSDYQAFFAHLYRSAEQQWRNTVGVGPAALTMMQRVHWYQLGSIDQWNLEDRQVQAHLRSRFEDDRPIQAGYVAEAKLALDCLTESEVQQRAWELCFADIRGWYESKQRALEGMKRFHHGVRSSTDLIDILEIGHWKVDLISRTCDEKGLDTRLALDMLALEATYDVAIVVSGDADSLPSIELMKRRGKHVGAVEFVRGSRDEQRTRSFSKHIKLAADFVIRIYEADLVARGVARRAGQR